MDFPQASCRLILEPGGHTMNRTWWSEIPITLQHGGLGTLHSRFRRQFASQNNCRAHASTRMQSRVHFRIQPSAFSLFLPFPGLNNSSSTAFEAVRVGATPAPGANFYGLNSRITSR